MSKLIISEETSTVGTMMFTEGELESLYTFALRVLKESYSEESDSTLSSNEFTVLYKIVAQIERSKILNNTYESENSL